MTLATVTCYRRNEAGIVLVIVRWVTDRRAFLVNSVFGERSKTKTMGAEHVLICQIAQNVWRVGFADVFWRSSCRLAPTQPPGGRLPTLRLPIRFGDPVVGFRRRNRLAVGYSPYVVDTFAASVVGYFLSPMSRARRKSRLMNFV
jgi:hypothetical protein